VRRSRCAARAHDGDRVAINMPNIPEQVYWTEACKRLGIVYTPVFGGFSDKTLSDRIHNAGARIVITADGGYRNAQIVPFKEAYTDPALDGYVPAEVAVARVAAALEELARDGLDLPAARRRDPRRRAQGRRGRDHARALGRDARRRPRARAIGGLRPPTRAASAPPLPRRWSRRRRAWIR
jgi:acyl-CoA synthetase (AMP-forming)/AMP-acid ligase II